MNDPGKPSDSDPELERLVARFHAGTLTRQEWTHAAHLEVGAWHVHHLGSELALVRLRDSIRRSNEQHGTPNTDERGYYETITVAYVRLLAELLRRCDGQGERALSACRRSLRLAPLADTRLLLRYWSESVLFSVGARREWVAPDRAPLALPLESTENGRT